MARESTFGRVVTAMVTPFSEDGELDVDGAVELARFLAASGSDAVVAAGTTGEVATLADTEKADLWRALSEALTIPVIAGATTNDTAHSLQLTRTAESVGVAGILTVTPYYNRPSQEGIFRHFSAVAAATSLPVVLYDIPVRTGRKIANETVLRLVASAPNVIGVKDASGDPSSTARLLATAPASLEIYSGDDSLTLALLAIGAVGAVSVASHYAGPEIAEMIRLFLAGDVERAASLNAELVAAVDFQSSEEAPNPLPAKAVLRAMGLKVGQCRLPHGEAPDWLDSRAEDLVLGLEALRQARRGGRASG